MGKPKKAIGIPIIPYGIKNCDFKDLPYTSNQSIFFVIARLNL